MRQRVECDGCIRNKSVKYRKVRTGSHKVLAQILHYKLGAGGSRSAYACKDCGGYDGLPVDRDLYAHYPCNDLGERRSIGYYRSETYDSAEYQSRTCGAYSALGKQPLEEAAEFALEELEVKRHAYESSCYHSYNGQLSGVSAKPLKNGSNDYQSNYYDQRKESTDRGRDLISAAKRRNVGVGDPAGILALFNFLHHLSISLLAVDDGSRHTYYQHYDAEDRSSGKSSAQSCRNNV